MLAGSADYFFTGRSMRLISASASDRRAVELRLTRSGRTFVGGALPDIHRNDHRATGMLTRRERETLMRLLHKMTGARLGGAST